MLSHYNWRDNMDRGVRVSLQELTLTSRTMIKSLQLYNHDNKDCGLERIISHDNTIKKRQRCPWH